MTIGKTISYDELYCTLTRRNCYKILNVKPGRVGEISIYAGSEI